MTEKQRAREYLNYLTDIIQQLEDAPVPECFWMERSGMALRPDQLTEAKDTLETYRDELMDEVIEGWLVYEKRRKGGD